MIGLAVVPFVGLLSAAPSQPADQCSLDVEHYLDCNNPRVIRYLKGLRPRDLGSPLHGVALSDGALHLHGALFLGWVEGLPRGVHVYVFERNGKEIANAWVEPDAQPFPLPDCVSETDFASAFVLSGDVYTWAALQPGHGVVESVCTDPTWKLLASPARAPLSEQRSNEALQQTKPGVTTHGPVFAAERRCWPDVSEPKAARRCLTVACPTD